MAGPRYWCSDPTMDQTVYMPGYSSGHYRPPVTVNPPQGSKLATYMNRGGPQQPHNFHDINNKMSNLSLMNRPPSAGSSYPGSHSAAAAPTYNRSSVSGYSVRLFTLLTSRNKCEQVHLTKLLVKYLAWFAVWSIPWSRSPETSSSSKPPPTLLSFPAASHSSASTSLGNSPQRNRATGNMATCWEILCCLCTLSLLTCPGCFTNNTHCTSKAFVSKLIVNPSLTNICSTLLPHFLH